MSDNNTALDKQIMGILRENGRISNIEIARQLNKSEATVRQRVKRMVESGSIRFKALVDLAAIGFDIVAIVRLMVRPDCIDGLVQMLLPSNSVHYLSRINGQYNVLAIVHVEDNRTLDVLVEETIARMPGVMEIDCRVIASAVKFDSRRAIIRDAYDYSDPIDQIELAAPPLLAAPHSNLPE